MRKTTYLPFFPLTKSFVDYDLESSKQDESICAIKILERTLTLYSRFVYK